MYDHFAFLAQVSPVGAEKLLEALTKDMKSLESNPHAYPYYNRPHSNPRKYRYVLSYSRYRIVYQGIGGWHGARRAKRLSEPVTTG
jgi:hypothetical protein